MAIKTPATGTSAATKWKFTTGAVSMTRGHRAKKRNARIPAKIAIFADNIQLRVRGPFSMVTGTSAATNDVTPRVQLRRLVTGTSAATKWCNTPRVWLWRLQPQAPVQLPIEPKQPTAVYLIWYQNTPRFKLNPLTYVQIFSLFSIHDLP